MQQSEMILYVVRLVLGGVAAFLAIMLWNRTRDAAWISLAAGAVTGYAKVVFEMLVRFGMIVPAGMRIAGIPLSTLLFTIIPPCFFILAFVLMLLRNE